MYRWVSLAGALVCLAVVPVSADEPEAPPEAQAEPLPPRPPTAQQLFEDGAREYEAGHFEQAIAYFQQARRLTALPALDYNIARSQDRLGHIADAIEFYRRFLSATPPTSDDRGARARLAELEALQRREAERRDAERSHTTRRRRTAIAISASVGVLALGSLATGLGLYVDSGHRYNALRAGGCGTLMPCDAARWGGTRIEERTGIGLLAVGGILVVADVALWVGWTRRELRTRQPVLTAAPLLPGNAL